MQPRPLHQTETKSSAHKNPTIHQHFYEFTLPFCYICDTGTLKKTKNMLRSQQEKARSLSF